MEFLARLLGSSPDGNQGEFTPVRLDTAAPDLAMVHLNRHKINYCELEKDETQIGQGTCILPPPADKHSVLRCWLLQTGGFAIVYKGTYKGEEVAIKILRNNTVDYLECLSKAERDQTCRSVFEEFRQEVWIMR